MRIALNTLTEPRTVEQTLGRCTDGLGRPVRGFAVDRCQESMEPEHVCHRALQPPYLHGSGWGIGSGLSVDRLSIHAMTRSLSIVRPARTSAIAASVS